MLETSKKPHEPVRGQPTVATQDRRPKAAFLQGNQSQAHRNVVVEPTPELRQALGLKEEEAIRLLKAVYGLCNAPLEWYLCERLVHQERLASNRA